mgnify:CR=1 FL=1
MAVPQHVAIILDGNGRWAQKKGMPRTYGHTVGAKNVERIARIAYENGVKYLTLYAFSTENWSRPDDEVKTLMKLLNTYLHTCLKTARRDNMRLRVIGDLTRLQPDLQELIGRVETETSAYTGLNLTIAVNYGGRDEIIRAMREMYRDLREKDADGSEITESRFASYLDTADLPDPDLMIRTSGEQRLSNFLLWQLAYAEFYFTPVAWPDFRGEEFLEALAAYENRKRRYGRL